MNEKQLAIVISVINEAAGQLSEIGTQLSTLGTNAQTAAEQMTSSLTDAEEQIVAQAQATVDAWEGSSEEMVASVEEAVPTIEGMLSNLAQSNEAAAQQVSSAWAASAKAMEDDLAAAMGEVEDTMVADATAAGEAAGGAAADGFGGYFKKMMVGYALDQIGSFLSGGIDSAIQAASKNQDQIATLTAQIDQQKAAIQTNEAALQKWTGSAAQVSAAHEKATANIEAEKAKIAELTQQLDTLQQKQQGIPGQLQDIENGFLGWIGSQKQLEGSLQTFMTTLGPLLEGLGKAFIAITVLQVALSVLDTPMLILIGIGVTIAALTAIWETFHTQITGFLDDLNAKTGIIDLFKQSWQSVSDNFNQNLKPALEQLWTALQPLEPYMKALALVVGVTLLGAVVLITDALTVAVNLFVELLDGATKLATFFTNVLVGALNAVERAIEAIITAVSRVGSVGGAIGGVINGALGNVFSEIKAFASGGIVTGPTLAMVGEAGPEAIIPLTAFSGGSSLGGSGGFGGGGINVYIQGGTYLDRNAATQIANEIGKQFMRQRKITNFS